jgi:hypothetical protein
MNTSTLMTMLAPAIRRVPGAVTLVRKMAKMAHYVLPEWIIVLDYPVYAKQRWTLERPHYLLNEMLERQRAQFERRLASFLELAPGFTQIVAAANERKDPGAPYWNNPWFPTLDAIAIYGFIAANRPRLYLEVGSGHSTRFARQAIKDRSPETEILSIDPCPRDEINAICDEVIRSPVEEVDLEIFDRLEPGDILFIDNSHRVLMNSDATMLFLDVLPRLKPGVLVQIHDICLPYDYPETWSRRYYSEQYVLAAYLLAKESRFRILLPNYFISKDAALRGVLGRLWKEGRMPDVPHHGCSIWLESQ